MRLEALPGRDRPGVATTSVDRSVSSKRASGRVRSPWAPRSGGGSPTTTTAAPGAARPTRATREARSRSAARERSRWAAAARCRAGSDHAGGRVSPPGRSEKPRSATAMRGSGGASWPAIVAGGGRPGAGPGSPPTAATSRNGPDCARSHSSRREATGGSPTRPGRCRFHSPGSRGARGRRPRPPPPRHGPGRARRSSARRRRARPRGRRPARDRGRTPRRTNGRRRRAARGPEFSPPLPRRRSRPRARARRPRAGGGGADGRTARTTAPNASAMRDNEQRRVTGRHHRPRQPPSFRGASAAAGDEESAVPPALRLRIPRDSSRWNPSE